MSKKKEDLPKNEPITTQYTTHPGVTPGGYWSADYTSRRQIEKEIALGTNRPYSIFIIGGRTTVHAIKGGKLACIAMSNSLWYTAKQEVGQVIDFINNG